MKRESIFLWKVVFCAAFAIIAAGWIFFSINNLATWMKLNDPFQGQWAAVQLSNGEILYGHLSGVSDGIIGLSDVYLLDKVSETTSTISSSPAGLSLTPMPSAAAPEQRLVPVSYTGTLYVNRAAVIYLTFVGPADPAFPYLH